MKVAKIYDLIPDNNNFNKHTQFGMHLLEKSIGTFGFGRSIVVDKNNRVIGGNGVLETAANLQLEDCIIVPTDGTKLVVVKREDLVLESTRGYGLALADNATANANLEWDEETITKAVETYEIVPQDWGVSFGDISEEEEAKEEQEKEARLVISCNDLTRLSLLFSELKDRGFKCEMKE